jgi:uncharacterized membrane protein YqhA
MPIEESDSSKLLKSEMPRLLKFIIWTRFLSSIAVISSLAATLLMLIIGTQNTFIAFSTFFLESFERADVIIELEPSEEATLLLLEALDNFLIGLAFLYFAYGIYSLFIRLDQNVPDFIPQWLRISDIATLKKKLLEVVVVLLSVIFVKGLLERLATDVLHWEALVIPLSIVAIALSIKLMSFDEE